MHLPHDHIEALRAAGFSLNDEERRWYIKTTVPLGQGTFGKVREAYRPARQHSSQCRCGKGFGGSRSCADCEMQLGADHRNQKTLLEDQYFKNGVYIRVALKEIDLTRLEGEREISRFIQGVIREAKVLRRVHCAKHLIKSYTPWYNSTRNRLCFPMELASMNLEQYFFDRWKTQPPKGSLLAICEQIILSVNELHTLGVIHRDIKMDNFLVFLTDDDRQAPFVKLADFGLSVVKDESPLDNRVVGTPYYMAPECWVHHQEVISDSHATLSSASHFCDDSDTHYARDVWAVGCIFFVLCHHQLPFTGYNHKVLRKMILEGRIVKKTQRDQKSNMERDILDFLAMQCLVKRPSQRPTMQKLHDLFISECQKYMDTSVSSPSERKLLERRQGELEEIYNSPSYLHFYQLMVVCRENCPVTIYPLSVLEPANRDSVESTLSNFILRNPIAVPPVSTLKFGSFVITDGTFYVYDVISKQHHGWTKVVYPCLGCCPLEGYGQHVLHPYSYRFRRACPPIEKPSGSDAKLVLP